MFLLIIPSTWFAFIAATEHCADDFPFWWIITPKSLSCSTEFSSFPPISYFPRWFLLPICNTIHLSTLNNICQSSDHWNNFFKSPLIISMSASLHTLLHILLSSANFQILDMMPSSMSFINIKNNKPQDDPDLSIQPDCEILHETISCLLYYRTDYGRFLIFRSLIVIFHVSSNNKVQIQVRQSKCHANTAISSVTSFPSYSLNLDSVIRMPKLPSPSLVTSFPHSWSLNIDSTAPIVISLPRDVIPCPWSLNIDPTTFIVISLPRDVIQWSLNIDPTAPIVISLPRDVIPWSLNIDPTAPIVIPLLRDVIPWSLNIDPTAPIVIPLLRDVIPWSLNIDPTTPIVISLPRDVIPWSLNIDPTTPIVISLPRDVILWSLNIDPTAPIVISLMTTTSSSDIYSDINFYEINVLPPSTLHRRRPVHAVRSSPERQSTPAGAGRSRPERRECLHQTLRTLFPSGC